MPYALMTSCGKDATLAFDRARREGLDVTTLACVYDGETERVRFHGTRHDLISRQAEALGLALVSTATSPDPFETVFTRLLVSLRERGIDGVIFGNIHIADVREWYEERVHKVGLEHVEPLWGEPSVEVAWEVVERGYRAIIVSVDPSRPAAPYLGREFDADVVTEISVIEDLDPCGEQGEYHTYVFDGPEFAHPVGFSIGATLEHNGHRYVDLLPGNGRRDKIGNAL